MCFGSRLFGKFLFRWINKDLDNCTTQHDRDEIVQSVLTAFSLRDPEATPPALGIRSLSLDRCQDGINDIMRMFGLQWSGRLLKPIGNSSIAPKIGTYSYNP